jgi:hypothetical protein
MKEALRRDRANRSCDFQVEAPECENCKKIGKSARAHGFCVRPEGAEGGWLFSLGEGSLPVGGAITWPTNVSTNRHTAGRY